MPLTVFHANFLIHGLSINSIFHILGLLSWQQVCSFSVENSLGNQSNVKFNTLELFHAREL
jgi:hypothetical protein